MVAAGSDAGGGASRAPGPATAGWASRNRPGQTAAGDPTLRHPQIVLAHVKRSASNYGKSISAKLVGRRPVKQYVLRQEADGMNF